MKAQKITGWGLYPVVEAQTGRARYLQDLVDLSIAANVIHITLKRAQRYL